MSRRIAGILLLLIAAVMAPAVAAARTNVSGLRLGIHPDGVTRIALDTSAALEVKARLLADPYRVVLDAGDVDWQAPLAVPKPVGAVTGLRWDETGGGHLVIELRRPAAVKAAFAISPRDGLGWRLVIDLKEVGRDEFLAAASGTGEPASRPAAKAASHAAPAPRAAPVPPPVPAATPNPAPPAAAAAADPAPAEPAPNLAPNSPAPNSIVVMSPLAVAPRAQPQMQTAAPAQVQPQLPVQPVAVDPPAAVIPAVAAAPAPTPVPPLLPLVQPTAASVRGGGSILSAPMPPPPERPAAAIPAVATAPPPAAEQLPVTPVAAPALPPPPLKAAHGDGRPVIVIDPGHGGVDPGATGISGIYEKVITLAVARELKAQLEHTGRFHVHLTRDNDVFIPLRERVQKAHRWGADLFVSLHADVVKDPQIRGLSIYTLSQTASDAEAQALADKENKADLIAGVDLSHESADVANILIDLAQRETMNRSAAFAGEIVEELGRETALLSNTHRFAGFAVLKGPDVPAVLIETGYLSNEVEEHNLRTPDYRGKLARAITRAVERFFQQEQRARRP